MRRKRLAASFRHEAATTGSRALAHHLLLVLHAPRLLGVGGRERGHLRLRVQQLQLREVRVLAQLLHQHIRGETQ